MSDEVHIAFAVDAGYLRQVAVTIASIVDNAERPEALRFHVLHDEDSAIVAEEVGRWQRPNVLPMRVDNRFSEIRWGHVSVAALLRTLLPEVFPDLSRIIYLDADLVVLRDIAQLWRTELGSAAMAGVVDIGIYQKLVRGEHRGRHGFRDHLLKLGMDLHRPQYVNSGLLVMDLEKLRDMDFAARAHAMHESQQGQRFYADQSIVNALLANGGMALLDSRWNVQSWTHSHTRYRWRHFVPRALQGELAAQRREQWVLHYTGTEKPWNSDGAWQAAHWWRYAKLSGLDWPAPAPSPSRNPLTEAWLDAKAAISALRTRFQRPRYL